MNPKDTQLPYIIERLVERGIVVGLTTGGITLIHLERDHNAAFRMLNDIDISLDSPLADEHNNNRGASLYSMAIRSLEICGRYGIDHTLIMCSMTWNFSLAHIDSVIDIARRYDAHIRINPLKAVQRHHVVRVMDAETFYRGFARLMAQCSQVDLREPLLASACGINGRGCPSIPVHHRDVGALFLLRNALRCSSFTW